MEQILGFGEYAEVQDLIDGGIKFCALSWQNALAQYPQYLSSLTQLMFGKYPKEDPNDLYTFCFGANYIYSLLAVGYGFPLDTELAFSKTNNNAPYTCMNANINS